MKDLDTLVVKALIDSSLSSYKIAQDTGISDTTISNYKRNRTKPNFNHIKTLANYFGIYPNRLGEFEITKPHKETSMDSALVKELMETIKILTANNKKLTDTNDRLTKSLLDALDREQLSKDAAPVGVVPITNAG